MATEAARGGAMTNRPYNLQEKIYAFIADFITEHRYPPTVKEIGYHFQIGKSTAYYHLKMMAAKGWLTWEKSSPRTLRLMR
jgi:repressor LexA